MQFKMFEEPKTLDESPQDFWERLLADPVSLLPSREKQELSFSSPVFVPIQQSQSSQHQMDLPAYIEDKPEAESKPKH